jgi:hypothetical protein
LPQIFQPQFLVFLPDSSISIQISAQIDELFAQHTNPEKADLHTGNSRTDQEKLFSKKSEPAQAGLKPAKAGPPAKAGLPAGQCLHIAAQRLYQQLASPAHSSPARPA